MPTTEELAAGPEKRDRIKDEGSRTCDFNGKRM